MALLHVIESAKFTGHDIETTGNWFYLISEQRSDVFSFPNIAGNIIHSSQPASLYHSSILSCQIAVSVTRWTTSRISAYVTSHYVAAASRAGNKGLPVYHLLSIARYILFFTAEKLRTFQHQEYIKALN
jgi:hypothetical protein